MWQKRILHSQCHFDIKSNKPYAYIVMIIWKTTKIVLKTVWSLSKAHFIRLYNSLILMTTHVTSYLSTIRYILLKQLSTVLWWREVSFSHVHNRGLLVQGLHLYSRLTANLSIIMLNTLTSEPCQPCSLRTLFKNRS